MVLTQQRTNIGKNKKKINKEITEDSDWEEDYYSHF
jgi:hypothetical protein